MTARPWLTSLSAVKPLASVVGWRVTGLVTPVLSTMLEVLAAHRVRATKQSFMDSCTSAIQALSKPRRSALCTTSTVCAMGSRGLMPRDMPTFMGDTSR